MCVCVCVCVCVFEEDNSDGTQAPLGPQTEVTAAATQSLRSCCSVVSQSSMTGDGPCVFHKGVCGGRFRKALRWWLSEVWVMAWGGGGFRLLRGGGGGGFRLLRGGGGGSGCSGGGGGLQAAQGGGGLQAAPGGEGGFRLLREGGLTGAPDDFAHCWPCMRTPRLTMPEGGGIHGSSALTWGAT